VFFHTKIKNKKMNALTQPSTPENPLDNLTREIDRFISAHLDEILERTKNVIVALNNASHKASQDRPSILGAYNSIYKERTENSVFYIAAVQRVVNRLAKKETIEAILESYKSTEISPEITEHRQATSEQVKNAVAEINSEAFTSASEEFSASIDPESFIKAINSSND
jgi:hypothetical protein